METTMNISLYSEIFKTLSECLTKGEIGFLIGNGMSIDSGIKASSELAKCMLRRAVLGSGCENDSSKPAIDEQAARYPFESISGYLTKKLPTANISGWLRQHGGFSTAKPNEAHENLRALNVLLGSRFPKMIFTTNFDNLIEDELKDDAIGITTSNLTDLEVAREERKIAIIHLHGALRYPDSIIYGEKTQITLEGPLFDLLRAALATEVFVLIGYSLSDTNLRNIFFDIQAIAETRKGLKKRTFAVSYENGDPLNSETNAGIAKAIWLQRDVEHLSLKASDFFKFLFEATDNFVLFGMKELVASRLNKDPETLTKMLESIAAPYKIIEPNDLLMYLYYALTPIKGK